MSASLPPAAASPARQARRLGLAAGVAAVVALVAGVWAYPAFVPAPAATSTSAQWTDRVEAGVKQAVAAGRVTVVELGSTACVGCREMKPVLHALQAEQGSSVQVVDIDILKDTAYISRYAVRLMPTQLFYDRQGRLLGRHEGVIDVAGLRQRLGLEPGSDHGR